jgi:hypothetical protein
VVGPKKDDGIFCDFGDDLKVFLLVMITQRFEELEYFDLILKDCFGALFVGRYGLVQDLDQSLNTVDFDKLNPGIPK